jgi:hypothetical protein
MTVIASSADVPNELLLEAIAQVDALVTIEARLNADESARSLNLVAQLADLVYDPPDDDEWRSHHVNVAIEQASAALVARILDRQAEIADLSGRLAAVESRMRCIEVTIPRDEF